MAKGGGAKGPSKKAVDKAKQKVIEDKTFGLKNKSKSKKVQKHVTDVKRTVNQVHDKKTKKEMEEREKKRLEKLEMKKREEELKALFKSADPDKPGVDETAQEQEEEEEQDDLYDQIDQEIADEEEMTIEDIIEKERAKILTGTPVTFESFTKWKQFKIEQLQKEEERRKKAARESGILTGRDLFEYNQSLFVDDEAAGQKEDYARDDDVDDSLFLEEDDEDEEPKKNEQITEYAPDTWKDPKTPKEKLQDYFNDKRWPLPKYECTSAGQGFTAKILTSHDKREFSIAPKSYPNKKLAEQNVALLVYNNYTKSVFK